MLTKLISDRAQAEHVRLQQKLMASANPPKNFLRWSSNTNDKDASVIGDVNAGWGTTWTRGTTLLVPDVPCGCVEVIVPYVPPVPIPTFRGIAQWAVDAGQSVAPDLSCAAISVVTDLCGNLYVAGFYSHPMNVYSYSQVSNGIIQETIYGWLDSFFYPSSLFLIKYSSSGTVLSAASIGGLDPTTLSVAGTYLTINSFNRITVLFRMANVINYTIYPFATPSQNVPYNDPAGRINSTPYGYLYQPGAGGFGVIQYNGTTGNVNWATYVQEGIPFSICSNSIGGTAVCGTTTINQQLFNATGTVAIGQVIVTPYGTLVGGASGSGFLIQYDASGRVQWASNQLGQDIVPYSLATDRYANIYVTGRFTNTIQFNSYISLVGSIVNTVPLGTMTGVGATDVFLTKYRINGLCDWATGLLGSAGSTNRGLAIAVDSSSNLCLTGSFTSSPLQLNDASSATFQTVHLTPFANLFGDAPNACFLAKYTDEGKALWATSLRAISAPSLDTDLSNNIYLACTYAPSLILNSYTSVYNSTIQTSRYGILQSGSSAAVAYSSQGRVLWAASQGDTSVAHGLAVDLLGNLILAGERGNQPLTVQSFTQIQTQLPLTIQQTTFGTLPGSSSNTYGFLAKYRTS